MAPDFSRAPPQLWFGTVTKPSVAFSSSAAQTLIVFESELGSPRFEVIVSSITSGFGGAGAGGVGAGAGGVGAGAGGVGAGAGGAG